MHFVPFCGLRVCTTVAKIASKGHWCLMNQTTSKLITICLVIFTSYVMVQGQPAAEKQFRVLVDASKDGGLWWFPQGPPNFNPNAYHQGKALADFMRDMGWKVTELPRGEVITFDKLREFDLVIRPSAYFSYSQEEALAYQQSVTAGTRLLLAGGSSHDRDAVAEIFGLRFETRSRFGPVKQWIPHALTANIQCCALAWTSLVELPPGAVALAWRNQANTNPQPIFGYLPYGKGSVVFVGQALISSPQDGAFSRGLIRSVGRLSPQEIAQLPMAALFVSDESVDLGPRLVAPASGAVLPQPESGEWRFDWQTVPSATRYEIVVLGPAAAFPMVRAVTSTSYFVRGVSNGYIIDSNLRGWTWRVRAQYQDGKWGPWSRIRSFNVKPRSHGP